MRELALGRLRKADLDRPRRRSRDAQADQLARFALAAFDGVFVAWQTDPGAKLGRLLTPLPAAPVAAHGALK